MVKLLAILRIFLITITVIILCCCVRIRIPRTKQEIEADFRRKQLSKRFKQELKRIRNSELDVMDLRRGIYKFFSFNNKRVSHFKFQSTALDRVRADFHSDTESFCGNQSDVFSSLAQGGVASPDDHSPVDSSGKNIQSSDMKFQKSFLFSFLDYNVTQQWLEMQMSKLRTGAPLPKGYPTQRV